MSSEVPRSWSLTLLSSCATGAGPCPGTEDSGGRDGRETWGKPGGNSGKVVITLEFWRFRRKAGKHTEENMGRAGKTG